MSQFPKWKYHADLPALVVDDEEAEEALGLDWFDTPAEAATPAADDKEAAELYRKELLAKAKGLGIEIHHLSGIDKIQAAIDAHEAE